MLFVRAEHMARVEEPFVRGIPMSFVEISSPSTRRLELVRKRQLYERYGVPEYWYIDLDADRLEMYRLQSSRYANPHTLVRGDLLESYVIVGFCVTIDDLLS